MIRAIYGYGHPVLKQVAKEVREDHSGLAELIGDMWETMEHADGVGLAAPQIGLALRIFVIDSRPMYPENDGQGGIRKCFINAHKMEESGESWPYEEGCLSIPEVRGEVVRPSVIKLRYMDEEFHWHEESFTGMNARVIQHEYDHIEGVLFTELLKPIRRRLIKRRLESIRKGNVKVDYRMKFRE